VSASSLEHLIRKRPFFFPHAFLHSSWISPRGVIRKRCWGFDLHKLRSSPPPFGVQLFFNFSSSLHQQPPFARSRARGRYPHSPLFRGVVFTPYYLAFLDSPWPATCSRAPGVERPNRTLAPVLFMHASGFSLLRLLFHLPPPLTMKRYTPPPCYLSWFASLMSFFFMPGLISPSILLGISPHLLVLLSCFRPAITRVPVAPLLSKNLFLMFPTRSSSFAFRFFLSFYSGNLTFFWSAQ